MKTQLAPSDTQQVLANLALANQRFSERYPGVRLDRLPVHTLYGGAHLFSKDTATRLGTLAARHLSTFANDPASFARALGLRGADAMAGGHTEPARQGSDAWIAWSVYDRVTRKLAAEAVEDLRLDFEDGYGARADSEEDGHAEAAARSLADGVRDATLPPFIGIRIKALTEEAKRRSLRTLDIFLSTFAAEGVALPTPFFVTLPKVTSPEQVDALVTCIELLEARCGFPSGAIQVEVMIETIQSIINPTGENGIPALVDAGRGRVSSAILGTFDYTASCNIASHYQDHRHPSADFARQMMQVCLTGTSVNICDGITNIMPIPPHRGHNLSAQQVEENARVVHEAWRLHFTNIMHSLRLGFYQGWDLNPAQLPIRFAACYYFFLEGLADASARLKTFIDRAAQASMVGNTFDDAASGQGLLNFFVNGINCGALHSSEALATGITLEELHGRSFQQIVKNRLDAT